MKCCHKDCEVPAVAVVQFNYPAARFTGHVGFARILSESGVCEQHKSMTLTELMDEDYWKTIEKASMEHGMIVADRDQGYVQFVPLGTDMPLENEGEDITPDQIKHLEDKATRLFSH